MIPLDEDELAVLARLRKKSLSKPFEGHHVVTVRSGIRALHVGLTYGEKKWNLSVSSKPGKLPPAKLANARLIAKALGAPPTAMLISPKGVIHWAWYSIAEKESDELPTEEAPDGRWQIEIERPGWANRLVLGRCPDREEATGVFSIDAKHRRDPATYFAVDLVTHEVHRMGAVRGPGPTKGDA